MSAPVLSQSAIDTRQPAEKPLRIAVLNRLFKPTSGGAERYSIALVEQLAPRHEIHVFAQQIEHDWPGVTYHRIAQPFTRPRWINQLWFALATWWATRNGFDVVHSHENTWHGQVQTVHVLPVTYSLLQGRHGWRRALRWLKIATSPRLLVYLGLERARFAAQPNRCIVLASRTQEPVMAQTFPQIVGQCCVVNPGVAAVPGWASAVDRRSARQQLGLPQAGHCVLFVGNDFSKKGLPALLEAMASLPDDVYLAVVGNPGQVSSVRQQLDKLGLGARVFFLGAMSNVDAAYQAADCLAHPTLEDSFAMVVLEAMAHGLPVVVSCARYCGIAAEFQTGVQALILEDPRDAVALAGALQQLLGDAALAVSLRAQGEVFARQHLWSQMAQAQELIYRRVAGRGSQ